MIIILSIFSNFNYNFYNQTSCLNRVPTILKRICYEVQTLISYKAYEKAPYRCLHDIDMVLFKKKERGEKGVVCRGESST